MAFYGVNTADANAVIEMAIGGKAATQLYEGERKFKLDKNITIEQPFNNRHTKYIKGALIMDLDNLKKESIN